MREYATLGFEILPHSGQKTPLFCRYGEVRKINETERRNPTRSQTLFGNALPETPFRVRFSIVTCTSYRMCKIDSHPIIIGTNIGYCYRERLRPRNGVSRSAFPNRSLGTRYRKRLALQCLDAAYNSGALRDIAMSHLSPRFPGCGIWGLRVGLNARTSDVRKDFALRDASPTEPDAPARLGTSQFRALGSMPDSIQSDAKDRKRLRAQVRSKSF